MSKKPVRLCIPVQSIPEPLLPVTSIQEKNIDYFANFANNISTSLCDVPAPGIKVRSDSVHTFAANATSALIAVCYHDRQQHELQGIAEPNSRAILRHVQTKGFRTLVCS